ncbi:MAG TPA: hypothetical protein PLF61_05810 [Candidatus Goldiibacteriota bacterium]|mgnify:CR=1 FL=1|nr:hypothetical protein [Candidatus Goldiibacteriota bacterium]
MAVYFFLFWLSFLMLYNVLDGFFRLVRDSFWGYYERITKKIERYSVDSQIYGQEDLMINTLVKQQTELEDIMKQYVFYRFCERISVYMSQIDMIILFCVSIVTVIFLHSAILAGKIMWIIIWIIVYAAYMWNEISGSFIKFEMWATNIFLRQYKVLTSVGGIKNIIEAKKSNKKILRNFYVFFILPLSIIALLLMLNYIIYPLLPNLPADLQKEIFRFWALFSLPGILFVAFIPVFLDKILNARLHLNFQNIKEAYYAVIIYIFFTLIISIIVSVSRYII